MPNHVKTAFYRAIEGYRLGDFRKLENLVR